MSTSPFLPPSRRRSRESARQRTRKRVLAVFTIAVAGLVAIFLLVRSNASSSTPAGALARSGRHYRLIAAGGSGPRSRLGLPLGKPALTLNLADLAADPVQLPFRDPPKAGLLVNLDTGQVLWQRNALERLRVASLTKMMTALITVKSAPANAPVLVTRQAVESQGSKVGVLPLGRHIRLETMLYGLLLPSGNDAAIALAQHVAGTVPRFVAEMNAEAAKLGLGCTRYSSPSGYYDEGNYSCAADLAVLAHDDLEQPRIARVVRSATAVLPFPIKGGKLYLYNNNPLLIYGYPGVTGMKTGYTIAAGKCLVATAQRHGMRLGVVLLNSLNPATQARQLLDYAFTHVYHQRPLSEPPIPFSE
jgi:serine-type D-Ala-D-Ala carboxypeptidase (penicillin-binding protein 5/6)